MEKRRKNLGRASKISKGTKAGTHPGIMSKFNLAGFMEASSG